MLSNSANTHRGAVNSATRTPNPRDETKGWKTHANRIPTPTPHLISRDVLLMRRGTFRMHPPIWDRTRDLEMLGSPSQTWRLTRRSSLLPRNSLRVRRYYDVCLYRAVARFFAFLPPSRHLEGSAMSGVRGSTADSHRHDDGAMSRQRGMPPRSDAHASAGSHCHRDRALQ